MTNDNTYNGWANYETWNVTLWIGGDEGIYAFVRNGLADLLECATDNSWENVSETDLRELVRDSFGSNKTPDGVSVMNPALDWSEIIAYLHEVAQSENILNQTEGN